jgi:hypothetical protein
MKDTISSEEKDQIDRLLGNWRDVNHTRDGFYDLASRALKVGIYCFVRLLKEIP